MLYRSVLGLILFCAAGCGSRSSSYDEREQVRPSFIETRDKSHSQERPHEHIEERTLRGPQKAPPHESIRKSDPTVEIIPFTEEFARENDVLDVYHIDPGFDKWLISFHTIPSTPPYKFEQKRILQLKQGEYHLFKQASPESILEAKQSHEPARLVISARGYAPGEEITIRLSGQHAHKEITFCPRPLVLKDGSGKLLAKATLVEAAATDTLYSVNICGVEQRQKCTFISESAGEILSHAFEGPIESLLQPGVVGAAEGISRATLQFEDGSSYTLELPWGEAVISYLDGNK